MSLSSRPLHLLTVLVACLSCTREAAAHPRGPNAPYVVTIEDEHGRELRTFHHEGQTFVLGQYGDRYTIRVQNRTARRVEAVVSVDGRDVVSGRIGDFVRERGYLVDAYDSVAIEGFRQTTSEVAAFRFTSPSGSYSAQMGTPENVGVIGVAIFPERVRPLPLRTRPQHLAPPRPMPESYLRNSAPASRAYSDSSTAGEREASARDDRGAGSGYAAAPAESRDNLGTEYGESLSSAVEERPFERERSTSPASVIALRYDDREGLLARGIALEPVYRAQRPSPCGPDAFPGNGFAPPPCRD